MIYRSRFIGCSKCATLAGILITRVAMIIGCGWEIYGKSLPSQIYYNFNTALDFSFLKKKDINVIKCCYLRFLFKFDIVQTVLTRKIVECLGVGESREVVE